MRWGEEGGREGGGGGGGRGKREKNGAMVVIQASQIEVSLPKI